MKNCVKYSYLDIVYENCKIFEKVNEFNKTASCFLTFFSNYL